MVNEGIVKKKMIIVIKYFLLVWIEILKYFDLLKNNMVLV